VKGGLKVGGVGVGGKAGVYLNLDSHGNPTDVGVRVSGGPSVTYDNGVNISGPGSFKQDFSLAPYVMS
jgi:hypothetical protein